MTPSQAFFTVHRDLPREGPGVPEDVHWALDIAATPDRARICDAACGPGADTVTLAKAKPNAAIVGVDLQDHFLTAAKRACPTAEFYKTDYADLPGTYDLIWCAGAMYFKGFETVLNIWRQNLLSGGRVAFSEPAFVSDPPSAAAQAFWQGEEQVDTLPVLHDRLAQAGWHVLGTRWLIGAPWKAYYTPMKKRLAMLRADDPNDAVLKAIAQSEQEIANWEVAPDQIAYALFVVEPA